MQCWPFLLPSLLFFILSKEEELILWYATFGLPSVSFQERTFEHITSLVLLAKSDFLKINLFYL